MARSTRTGICWCAISVEHIVVHRDGEVLERAAKFEMLKHAAHRPEPDQTADIAVARHLLHHSGINATAPQRPGKRECPDSAADNQDPRHARR